MVVAGRISTWQLGSGSDCQLNRSTLLRRLWRGLSFRHNSVMRTRRNGGSILYVLGLTYPSCRSRSKFIILITITAPRFLRNRWLWRRQNTWSFLNLQPILWLWALRGLAIWVSATITCRGWFFLRNMKSVTNSGKPMYETDRSMNRCVMMPPVLVSLCYNQLDRPLQVSRSRALLPFRHRF